MSSPSRTHFFLNSLKVIGAALLLLVFSEHLLSQEVPVRPIKVKRALDPGTEKDLWWEECIQPVVEETFQEFAKIFRIQLLINKTESLHFQVHPDFKNELMKILRRRPLCTISDL